MGCRTELARHLLPLSTRHTDYDGRDFFEESELSSRKSRIRVQAHQGDNGCRSLRQVEEVANLFGQSSADVVGSIVLTLIKTIWCDIPKSVKSGFHVSNACFEKWVQKVGPTNVVINKDYLLFCRVGMPQAEWDFFFVVSEDHRVVYGHQLSQGKKQAIVEMISTDGIDRI